MGDTRSVRFHFTREFNILLNGVLFRSLSESYISATINALNQILFLLINIVNAAFGLILCEFS